MHAAMQDLPTKKRIPFALYYLEGLKLQEIADCMGISVQTAHARIKSGREVVLKFIDRKEASIRKVEPCD